MESFGILTLSDIFKFSMLCTWLERFDFLLYNLVLDRNAKNGFISNPNEGIPSSFAARIVVPLPANGSNTKSCLVPSNLFMSFLMIFAEKPSLILNHLCLGILKFSEKLTNLL